MTTAAQQPSREELLAIGKKKLLHFQQSKGKPAANTAHNPSAASSASVAPLLPSTARLPTVTLNGTSATASKPSQPPSSIHPSFQYLPNPVVDPAAALQAALAASSHPALTVDATPRRDLLPFLDAVGGTSEPGTPPSSAFHASHASFLQPDQHTDDELSQPASAQPTRPPSAASSAPSYSQSLVAPSSSSTFADVNDSASAYSAYDAQADYNPYAEPPPAVLARSGAVTPQPTESQPPPTAQLAPTLPAHLPQPDAVAVKDSTADPSFQSYFAAAPTSSAPPASAFDSSVATTSVTPAATTDAQTAVAPSFSSDNASTPADAPAGSTSAAAAETELSADGAAVSVQYYQDDAGNIFYYTADGQPVYYNQSTGEYSTSPPSAASAGLFTPSSSALSSAVSSDDVPTLQAQVAEYERYIATLQSSLVSSSASPLPALSSLSAELDLSRTDNERLRGQLRQLQARLEAQGRTMSELMEDNATLVHEYEEVSEQLQSAENERQQGWLQHRPEDAELARQDGLSAAGGGALYEHSDLLQQLADNSGRMQREVAEGTQLNTSIRAQWQHILALIQLAHDHSAPSSAPSTADASHTAVVRANGVDGGKADWLSMLQQAEALTSLLSEKEDHDHRLSMNLTHIRQLLDPVALVLSPSHSQHQPPTSLPLLLPASTSSPAKLTASHAALSADSSTAADSAASSSSSAIPAAALSSLQLENSLLHDQLAAQRERADTLIKDKVLLAKRIERSFEEKAVLTESLREALDELGREKEMYRQAVQESHNAATRTANTVAYLPSPASAATAEHNNNRYADESTSMHAAYKRLHTPGRQGGSHSSARTEKMRRELASRRKADEASGLFGSLWSLVFGSSVAQVIADEEEEEEEDEEEDDLEASRVILL